MVPQRHARRVEVFSRSSTLTRDMTMAEEQTISVRGGAFETHLFIEGAGAPLLFLHGVTHLSEWPGWLTPFAEKRRVIAPEHPGFGESTGLEHLDDFADLTFYYLELLDALNLAHLDVMGHSLGGNIAAELAALCPERVGKLVLVAPTGLWMDETPVLDFFSLTADQMNHATWHDVDLARSRGLIETPADEEAARAAGFERTRSLAAAGKFLWPIPDKGLKKRIHRISAPTLLVWGAHDSIIPAAYGPLFQKSIAGSRLVVLEGSGHMPMLEQPEDFTKTVLDFLAT